MASNNLSRAQVTCLPQACNYELARPASPHLGPPPDIVSLPSFVRYTLGGRPRVKGGRLSVYLVLASSVQLRLDNPGGVAGPARILQYPNPASTACATQRGSRQAGRAPPHSDIVSRLGPAGRGDPALKSAILRGSPRSIRPARAPRAHGACGGGRASHPCHRQTR